MKFRFFSPDVFQFPFRTHNARPARALFAGLSAIIFSLSAAASSAANFNAQSSEDARQLTKQAKKLTRRGDAVEAEKIFRRALEINPQESDAKLNLARLLLKRRQFIEAYNLSFDVARAEPKNSYALAVVGSVLLSAGKLRDAQVAFNGAIDIDERSALAWAGLGMLNFYENRILVGLEQLQTAVFIDPSEPDFQFTLAQIATRAEDYKQAAAAYERFLDISPLADDERRARIKSLVAFLRYLGDKSALYSLSGAPETTVPFRLVNDRPVIQINVNNGKEPLNFVLDTGSGISVISEETARRLKLKVITRGGLARAVGGDGKFEIVYGFLRSASLGTVKIRNIPVYMREFHNKEEQIDGYIGLALISKFLTTIDYGNSTFVLKKKVPLNNADKTETAGASLPLRLTSGGFLSGEVQLEGVNAPLNFIVDTGASISVISNELASLKEINRFISKEKMRIAGAAGITEDMPAFLLPKVSFGANSRESVKVVALDLSVINESTGFEQAGILGGNFLKNYRVTFDFNNSKVLFEPIKLKN